MQKVQEALSQSETTTANKILCVSIQIFDDTHEE